MVSSRKPAANFLVEEAVSPDATAFFHIMNDHGTPYFAALGKFITKYADAEAGAHILARHLSGMGENKARAVFRKVGIGDLKEQIYAMLHLDGHSEKTVLEVKRCLDQLTLVSDQRHQLVHRSVTYRDAAIYISNSMRAKSLETAEETKLSISDLDNMANDCVRIFLKLYRIVDPYEGEPVQGMNEWMEGPWSYVPPKTKGPKKKNDNAASAVAD